MKEFDNLRQLYIDKIRAVLRKSFDILTESENCIKWTKTTTSQFFSYSTLARISIFFSDNPLTFAQIVEYIEDRFPWFDFSKDEVWLEGIEKSLQEKDQKICWEEKYPLRTLANQKLFHFFALISFV